MGVVEGFQRQTAIKASVADVLHGVLFAGTQDEPTTLELPTGERSGRVSVVATLVEGVDRDGWIDDGTGLIQVRAFNPLNWPNVGSRVHVIGRVREYAESRYISIDVLRVIDDVWALVRKKELSLRKPLRQPVLSLAGVVDTLDDGSGADYEAIKVALGRPDAEAVMQHALETGEVFQVAPGRLKVLR